MLEHELVVFLHVSDFLLEALPLTFVVIPSFSHLLKLGLHFFDIVAKLVDLILLGILETFHSLFQLFYGSVFAIYGDLKTLIFTFERTYLLIEALKYVYQIFGLHQPAAARLVVLRFCYHLLLLLMMILLEARLALLGDCHGSSRGTLKTIASLLVVTR